MTQGINERFWQAETRTQKPKQLISRIVARTIRLRGIYRN